MIGQLYSVDTTATDDSDMEILAWCQTFGIAFNDIKIQGLDMESILVAQ